MLFSVGYRAMQSPAFVQKIIQNRQHISEVYFAWGGFANGRNDQRFSNEFTPWEATSRMTEDLKQISDAGVKLNVLFNAMCYGKDSLSRDFFNRVGQTVDWLGQNYALQSVTTTSPMIAKFIKSNFPQLDVRASVNMEIGTREGMEYLAEWFDSFYAKRELNRDLAQLKELKTWCDANGKMLHGLANSGCLNHCSAHVFHDNLVAHENEIAAMDNGFAFTGVCKQFMAQSQNHIKILDRTNFIRPEDIPLYQDIFSSVKLATRVHPNPCRILQAYIEKGRFGGNVLDILEPVHSAALYPYILENGKISAHLQEDKLIYKNIENALVKLEEDVYVNSRDD